MVEVFKTNVRERWQAELILKLLSENLKGCQVNFDLEDCDKILRIEGLYEEAPTSEIIEFMRKMGFEAEILE